MIIQEVFVNTPMRSVNELSCKLILQTMQVIVHWSLASVNGLTYNNGKSVTLSKKTIFFKFKIVNFKKVVQHTHCN